MISSESDEVRKSRGLRRKRERELRQKFRKGRLRETDVEFATGGDLKMSEVLLDFVEPYREIPDDDRGFRSMVVMAIMAWNAALMPEDERQDFIQDMMRSVPDDVRDDFRVSLDEMIERKERHFFQYKRPIVDYELEDRGDDWHLSVASVAEPEEHV